MKYSFDTSAFINPYRHFIPMDIFPTLWDKLDELIASEIIVTSKEVQIEIQQKDDELLEWIKNRKDMFIEVDEEQAGYVEKIVNMFPKWIDPNSRKNNADPYCIALAQKYNLNVVSFEKGGSFNSPKIPFVCKQVGVKHLFFYEFLREIKFKA